MKKFVLGAGTLIAVTAASLGGTETYSGPASKEFKQVQTVNCFSDTEIQADIFGAYEVGDGPNHAGPIHDHAWGGGVAMNYIFYRYFGVSAEGIWLNGSDSNLDRPGSGVPSFRHSVRPRDDGQLFATPSGNVIFRYPIERWRICPYVFTGGGVTFGDSDWAVYDVGLGLEYRALCDPKVGIFVDVRWNDYGYRYEHDALRNNVLIRLGTRLAFY